MAGNVQVLDLLEEMLDSGKTPEEVCRDCPELLAEVRRRWQAFQMIDAQVGALLPGLRTTPQADALTPVPPPAGLPEIPGYVVEAVLGSGGMGVVYRARQRALDRPVAVKMLLAGPLAGAQELGRFRRETAALASLRHPNIVQVYDAGDVEGRPYFSMELVEGGSLAQKLSGTPQQARPAAELLATLAEAVHVAHQGGIVHRDLKPGNILLTADGTPKIADFGLARRAEGGAGLTQSGIPLGTPGYMAPEQARGQAHAIGPAVDVYALGAILYELLTGRPPFQAETPTETLLLVINEEPVPPARRSATVPRDLETICLTCLQKEPAKRYCTATQLAADLGRFLRHEPIVARPAGRVEHILRWVRRRPAAAGLLAAVGLLLLVGGISAGLQYRQWAMARDRQAQTGHEVRRVLEGARALLERGWKEADLEMLTQAEAEGKRAEGMAQSGGASAPVLREANAFTTDARDRLGRADKNRTLLQELLDVSGPQQPWVPGRGRASRPAVLTPPSWDEQFAAAFRHWGLDVDGTPEAEVVERLGAEPDPVAKELIAALDGWMMERRRQGRPEAAWRRLVRVAERLDRNGRHRRLRAVLVEWSPPRPEGVAGLVGAGSPWPALGGELARVDARQRLRELRREIDTRTDPVHTVLLLAQAQAALGDDAGAEQVLREAATARPDDVVLLTNLGNLLEGQGPSRRGKAIEYYRAARARRPSLGLGLSGALIRAGRADEAEQVLRELIRQQPDNPALYHNLSASLQAQQKYAAAEAACRKAIDLEPDYPEVYYNLGNALNHQQKYGEAAAAYRKAIDLKPDYSEAHNNLASVLNSQQKYGEAEALLRRGLNLDPDSAHMHNNLGTALYGQQRYGEAAAAYRKAIDLNPGYGDAYHNLGSALSEQGKYADAEAAFRKTIDLLPRNADAYLSLGNAQSRQNKHAEAEAAFRKAIDLRPGFADAYHNLGNALSNQEKHGAAEAAYRKACELRPDFADAFNNLGMSLSLQQKDSAAEAAFRKVIELRPDLALAHFNLANVLMDLARFDEALARVKKGTELLAARDPLRERARLLLQQCQRYIALEARLPAILRRTEKPAGAAEQTEFAQMCLLKKCYAAAARFYGDAFTAEPKLAEAVPAGTRYDAACAAAEAGCAHGRDAETSADKERALWRRQAREWLRQDLVWWGKALDNRSAQTKAEVRRRMQFWQADSHLAGLREPSALEGLSSDERKECLALWQEVAALLRRVQTLK
jgi:serine/threonine-protein kinase